LYLLRSRALRLLAVDLLIIALGISIVSGLFIMLAVYDVSLINGLWNDRLYSWIGSILFM